MPIATAADPEVSTAVAGAVTTAKDTVSENMPLVFGVAIAFVAWSIGRRVLGKI